MLQDYKLTSYLKPLNHSEQLRPVLRLLKWFLQLHTLLVFSVISASASS